MDTSLHGGLEISKIFFLPNCAAERILYEKFFLLFSCDAVLEDRDRGGDVPWENYLSALMEDASCYPLYLTLKLSSKFY